MRMEHDGLWRISDAVSIAQPAVAKLAVLRRREPGVETADSFETLRCQRQVVAGKKLRLARARTIEMAVHNVKDKLTRRRVRILGERVYSAAPDDVMWQRCKPCRKGRQPFRVGAAVIIRKGKEPSGRPLGAMVARRSRPAVGGRNKADGKAILKRMHDGIQRRWAAVVSNDYLE